MGYSDGSITKCYASGSVSDGVVAGGFAAVDEGTITGSFFDSTVNRTGIGNTFVVSAIVTGLPTTFMTQESPYIEQGWDFTNTWHIAPNINHGYPYLQSWLAASLTPSTTDTGSNQSVSVTMAVEYGGLPVNQQEISLSVPDGDGTWSTGSSVTGWVYTDNAGQYTGIWSTPVVTTPTPVVHEETVTQTRILSDGSLGAQQQYRWSTEIHHE